MPQEKAKRQSNYLIHHHKMKVSAAFHNNRIIFDRRASVTGDPTKPYVDSESLRDRISACLTHRMIPFDKSLSTAQEQTPQLLFTPIYSGTEAVLSVASVVNTHPQSIHNTYLTEWRRSFHLGDYALDTLSNRFQELVRRSYLKEAAKIVFKSCNKGAIFFQVSPSVGLQIDEERALLVSINQQLDCLSRAFSYKKICFTLRNDIVPKKGRHYNIVKTPWSDEWLVDLVENPYWSIKSGICPLTIADIQEAFEATRVEIIARRSLEIDRRSEFCHLYYDKFGDYPSADVLANWKFNYKKLLKDQDD